MNFDAANAAFECVGACLLWLNVRRLLLDQRVQGVSLLPPVFFGVWGFFNLHYYAHLGQPLSLIASTGMLSAHVAWLVLAVFFTWKGRTQ